MNKPFSNFPKLQKFIISSNDSWREILWFWLITNFYNFGKIEERAWVWSLAGSVLIIRFQFQTILIWSWPDITGIVYMGRGQLKQLSHPSTQYWRYDILFTCQQTELELLRGFKKAGSTTIDHYRYLCQIGAIQYSTVQLWRRDCICCICNNADTVIQF